VYEQKSDTFSVVETTQLKQGNALLLLRPYFTALVPDNTDEKPKVSILQVSLHESNKVPALVFRYTSRKNGAWTTKTSKPVVDSLAANKRYFHIKWIRCFHSSERVDSDNALLEIFSFYGALGIRVFALSDPDDPSSYIEAGQQQYLGQTSIGTGLGAEGDWGNGFFTWGPFVEDFIDQTVWTPNAKSGGKSGVWGMQQTDIERPSIRGWEVEKRPGYYKD
jgi:hypothetical protein